MNYLFMMMIMSIPYVLEKWVEFFNMAIADAKNDRLGIHEVYKPVWIAGK